MNKRNFLYYLLPSLVSAVVGIFVAVPIITLYLGPKDYGIFAILNAITVPLTIASIGVTWIFGGNYFRLNEEERKVLIFNVLVFDLVVRFFLTVVFLLSAPSLLPLVINDYDPSYQGYFLLLVLSILLSTLWSTISPLLVFQEKAHLYALFEFVGWLTGTIAVIVSLTMFDMGTSALFIGQLTTGMFLFFGGAIYIRSYISPHIQRRWIKEIVTIGMSSVPSTAFTSLTEVANRFFIQHWITLSSLGMYSHSLTYRGFFMSGFKAFNRVFVPTILCLYAENRSIAHLIPKLKKWYGLLGIAGVFGTFFSYDIINIITHGKFNAAAPLVPLWFLLMLVFTFGTSYIQFLFSEKKTFFVAASSIAIGTLFLGVSAFFVYRWGIIGAVIAAVLASFFIQFAMRMYALKWGCPRIAEREFFSLTFFLIGVYIFSVFIPLSFPIRLGIFLICSLVIGYWYDLFSLLRQWKFRSTV